MKKSLFIILVFCLITLLAFVSAEAQQLNTISAKCANPNQRTMGSVRVQSNNILIVPCVTGATIFTGNVNFSGATIAGLQNGTLNAFPYNNTTTTQISSPFSWNGTIYTFNNTARNGTFTATITPDSTGSGLFSFGNTTVGIAGDEDAGQVFHYGASNQQGVTNYLVNKTNTATIGNVTINKPAGIVIMGNGTDEVIVTNSIVTGNSLILITSQELDASCTRLSVGGKNTGNFRIKAVSACSADTPIAFLVLN